MYPALRSLIRLKLFDESASTRALGLFRIVLILLLWARYAQDLSLWKAVNSPETLAIGVAFYALTTLALVGFQTRRVMTLLAGVVALIYFHLGLNLGHVPFTHHHTYLLFACTVLCALGPCDRSFSLDRWLKLKRGVQTEEYGPTATNHLFRIQLAAVYFWTAIDKTSLAFLDGTRLEQILQFHYHDTIIEPVIATAWTVTAMAVAVVLIEYFLALAILLRRWIWPVLGAGALLHGAFYWMLPVSTFSLTMLAMYIFIFRPEAVHRTLDQLLSPSHERLARPAQ